MKYCSHCGAQIDDQAIYCPNCGSQEIVYPQPTQPVYQERPTEKSTMLLIAFIFCILSTISIGWFLIPLAWMIPMTIKCYKAYQNNTKLSTGFGVCTLLFVNLVAGILILVDSADNN